MSCGDDPVDLRTERWTYEAWLTLPDDGYRYEVLDGTLVREPPPATAHQAVVRRVLLQLARHLSAAEQEGLFASPVGVRLADDAVVQPDVLYLRPERRHLIGEQVIEGAPDVIVEVLSPSTRQRDLQVKGQLYARHGVREYWVIDPRDRRVHRYDTPSSGGYGRETVYGVGDQAVSPALGWTFDPETLFKAYR